MDRTYDSVVCAGMDVHHKFSQVTFRDGEAAVVRRERVDHQDRAALRRQLSGWPRGLTVVMESSFGWGWLSDVLLALGLCPRLSDCFKVSKKREALGWAKTNKKDADLLSLLPFEATPWWETWLAPPAVRQCREWMRFRTDLTQVGTETKNRIHAVLHRYGIFHDFSDLFGGGGRRFLAELCAGEHVVLPPGALWALQGYVMLLNQVRCQLAPLEQRLRSRLEATPEVRLIKTIPGFGVILSHTVHAEVGRIDRFAGQKRLASYCLLAPQANETGEHDPRRAPLGRRLGHRGNRTLKWAFIEAAHGAVRSGGRWRAMWDRYTDGGRKDRNRGYIKVARELVKVVYSVWKHQRAYSATPPPRGGQPARRRAKRQARRRLRRKLDAISRSGTGQLSRPMVAAR